MINYFYANKFSNKSNLTVNISKTFLEQLPIKIVSSDNQQGIISHADKMISLNKKLVELGDKQTSERQKLEDEIKKTNSEIDELVYQLYGIIEEEKKTIEESLN